MSLQRSASLGAGLFFTIAIIVVALFYFSSVTIGSTEHAVRFRRLPPQLLGGLAQEVIPPGKTVIVTPLIDELYPITTAIQEVSWGANGNAGTSLYTRAFDGNEVALAVTILYQVRAEPEQLVRLVSEVASSDEQVRALVVAVGQSDIRTYMNQLRTAEFLEAATRTEGAAAVRESMQQRLRPLGIEVTDVILNDFRFERQLPEGGVDTSYQDRLRDIQRLREETERERSRIKTVEAKKRQEFNEMQGYVNRLVQEAQGYREQAEIRGKSYREARVNEAAAVRAEGLAAAEGLRAQIAALSGPGGDALAKIAIAEALRRGGAQFVVAGSGGASAAGRTLEVQRLDLNQLLDQVGMLEALQSTSASAAGSTKPSERPSTSIAERKE